MDIDEDKIIPVVTVSSFEELEEFLENNPHRIINVQLEIDEDEEDAEGTV
ncbi:MAG: hypothetical protein K6A45_10105 [Lachnospiraceae bacterium]|nr:hypothetical protein [Lachnospiraceae bacterium]